MLKGDITDPSAKFLLKQQQKCSILVLELSRLALPVRKYSKNCPLANLLCIFFKFLCKHKNWWPHHKYDRNLEDPRIAY